MRGVVNFKFIMTTLNSSISVGHGYFLESKLIWMKRINVNHINIQIILNF